MSVSFSYQVAQPTPVPPAPVLPSGAGLSTVGPSFLGAGLVAPFRRGANDFVTDSGVALIKASIAQVLGTRGDSPISRGELPWRTEFGSVLYLLRHRNNDFELVALAQSYAADAVGRWEPRVQILRADVIQDPNKPRQLAVRVRFEVITANVSANQVVLQDEVTVPLAA